jgi:hypothetical protein
MHPGQTITVRVTGSSRLSGVLVMGQDPIDACEALTGPSFQCSLKIPLDIDPGTYTLTASGVTASEETGDSDPVSIDVERPDNPVSLTTEPSRVELSIGHKTSLRVIGTYSDGSTVDLTESTQITFVSQSAEIVTVGPGGRITATGPGTTRIVINGLWTVPVRVDPPIKMVPETTTLTGSQTREFVAWVTTNPSNPRVTWSLNPEGAGSIDANGLYTAPDSITSQQTVILTATSVADPTKSASATVTLSPVASISISPGYAVLYPAQSLQLTATASNAGTAGIRWSINPAGMGSISSTGLYTAPASITGLKSVTVTAASVSKPAIFETQKIWLSAIPFVLFAPDTAINISQGGSGTLPIVELATDRFAHPIAFSIRGLPKGISASFVPGTAMGVPGTTLTLAAISAASPGTYTVNVIGTDTVYSTLTASAAISLTIVKQHP